MKRRNNRKLCLCLHGRNPKSNLVKGIKKKLRHLMLDLRWLITEGYVTEYGDGRLFAPPPIE